VNGGLGEETNGLAKICLAVINVGAEGKVDSGHIGFLLYADATTEETEHGVGFGEFQGEGDSKEDDAVEGEDENGEKDGAAMAESNEKTSRCGGGEKRSDPDLNQE
jgi:hypothetical protein